MVGHKHNPMSKTQLRKFCNAINGDLEFADKGDPKDVTHTCTAQDKKEIQLVNGEGRNKIFIKSGDGRTLASGTAPYSNTFKEIPAIAVLKENGDKDGVVVVKNGSGLEIKGQQTRPEW